MVDELAKEDSRVQYHCHPENIGSLPNFIYGAERVETPFFSFLSDDDLLLPAFYETALAGFEKYPEAFLSATATVLMDDQGSVHGVRLAAWRSGLYRPPEGMLSIVRNGHVEWISVLFRREAWIEAGGLDESVGGASDLDFELRAAARFPVVVSLQPGALFVIHRDSAGNSEGVEGLCPGWHKITCKIAGDEATPQAARSEVVHLLNKKLRRILLATWVGNIADGDWTKANQTAGYLSRYCRLTAEPFILNLFSEACRRFWPCRYVLQGLIGVRCYVRRVLTLTEDRRLQSRFACYRKLLEI